jgi:hypothetical protein
MNKKNLLLVLLVLLFGIAWYAYTAYNEGPRDLSTTSADKIMTASDLLSAFQEDEAKANADYLDKIISIEGLISSIDVGDPSAITLETGDMMSAVVCEMAEAEIPRNLKEGTSVTIKGQCTGFLSDVILVKCVIESNK